MYRIGEISKATKIKVPTIRYFEQVGLLDSPHRNEGNQRLYGEADMNRLKFIKRGRELGFSQAELKSLLGVGHADQPHCQEVYSLTQQHIRAIKRKIEDLQAIENQLQSLVVQCEKQGNLACPVLDSLCATT